MKTQRLTQTQLKVVDEGWEAGWAGNNSKCPYSDLARTTLWLGGWRMGKMERCDPVDQVLYHGTRTVPCSNCNGSSPFIRTCYGANGCNDGYITVETNEVRYVYTKYDAKNRPSMRAAMTVQVEPMPKKRGRTKKKAS